MRSHIYCLFSVSYHDWALQLGLIPGKTSSCTLVRSILWYLSRGSKPRLAQTPPWYAASTRANTFTLMPPPPLPMRPESGYSRHLLKRSKVILNTVFGDLICFMPPFWIKKSQETFLRFTLGGTFAAQWNILVINFNFVRTINPSIQMYRWPW